MKRYYVGISGTNVICNDNYFSGYITAYPIGEKNNVSFFESVDGIGALDQEKYKAWVQEQVEKVLKDDPSAKFTYFNKKMANICDFIPEKNVEAHNDWELLAFLNNKFEIRAFLGDKIRILDYMYLKGAHVDYERAKKELKSSGMVVQSATGAGGLTTHSIKSAEDMKKLNLNPNEKYSISAYEPNLPVNATLMISQKDVLQLPISTQLIKNTGNFIYAGGDFVFPTQFKPAVASQIITYNNVVGSELQKMGYRGICGVDYIVCEDGTVKFMELNPRYQGSSFLLSLALRNAQTSIAKLNAECFENASVDAPQITVNKSFVNCKNDSDYSHLGEPSEIIKKVENSTFRKVFDRSICAEDSFEKPDDLSSICL